MLTLSKRQINQLRTIIEIAEKMLTQADGVPDKARKSVLEPRKKRVRRSGKELAQFRKMLLAERKKGTPVAELAKAHNISPAYIYQLN